VPVRGKACQGSTPPVYVSEAHAHGADQQFSRTHAAARRHIAQDPLRDQKRGRNEVVWHADDVLPDMGAERGKRVRDAAENTRGDLTGYNRTTNGN